MEQQGPQQWPYPAGATSGKVRLYEDGVFPTASGRASFFDVGYTTTSPRLDYLVRFNRTGTHYVIVRAQGPHGMSDSVHVGLDGAAIASADRINIFPTTFAWQNNTADGVVATIDVPTVGLHTINVWMREDGVVFDKLVLTPSATFMPTDTGPAETR